MISELKSERPSLKIGRRSKALSPEREGISKMLARNGWFRDYPASGLGIQSDAKGDNGK
jgi:hypothetical protein